jgi:hypothetical protein
MPSRRRTANKNLSNNLAEVQRRLRTLERRPVRSKLGNRSVTGAAIGPNSVDGTQVSFGINLVAQVDPVSGDPIAILNPQDGQQVFDPYSGVTNTYSEEYNTYIETSATDLTAQSLALNAQESADGKNTVYRQEYEPTGGTYAQGDTWFDTDDDNKIYRYSKAITATITNKSLSGNVATLTVSSPHSFVNGETITVSGVDSTFNGSYTVTGAPNSLTVRYEKTASNVPSTSTSGTISNVAGWKGFSLGDGALLNISANKLTAGTIDARNITVAYIDASKITSGDLIGRTVRTSASGVRLEMSNQDELTFYNANNTVTGQLSPFKFDGVDPVTGNPLGISYGLALQTPNFGPYVYLDDTILDLSGTGADGNSFAGIAIHSEPLLDTQVSIYATDPDGGGIKLSADNNVQIIVNQPTYLSQWIMVDANGISLSSDVVISISGPMAWSNSLLAGTGAPTTDGTTFGEVVFRYT